MQERYARDNRGKNFYKPAKIYANSENKILEIKFIAHKKPEYLEVLNQLQLVYEPEELQP